MVTIESFEALDDALRRSHVEPIVFYKHSATCGVSMISRREVARLHHLDHVPVYEVVVQRARPISNELEQRFGVRHESPQALVVHRDRVTFHTSHGGVREDALREAIASLESTPASDD